MHQSGLLLFSGGQDSSTLLAWALENFSEVETVGFDYGQRHHIELSCRLNILARVRQDFPHWAHKLGADHLIPLPGLGLISETSLTRDSAFALQADGLPNSFVPGRNLLFLAYAGALAYRRGIENLIGGMCETDTAGYPDCRHNTLQALQTALQLGMERDFKLHTPLMQLTKADTWRLAEKLGGAPLIKIIKEETHSCYRGERGVLHPWGYGCGSCPACLLRAQGFADYAAGNASI